MLPTYLACVRKLIAIVDGLRGAKWPKLEKLKIGGRDMATNEWGFYLAGISEGGAGGDLRSLVVYEISDETVHELGRVLHKSACPKLRLLDVRIGNVSGVAFGESSPVKRIASLLRRRGIRTSCG